MSSEALTIVVGLVGIVSTLVTAIITYRSGMAKAKSLEIGTIQTIHSMVTSDAKRCYEQLKTSRVELENQTSSASKWRTGFSIVRRQARNAGVKSENLISYTYVEDSSIQGLRDKRDEISNSR